MSDAERKEAAEYRRVQKYPKHSLPHFDSEMECQYILRAACYEHAKIIGKSAQRMTETEQAILSICGKFCSSIDAWCFLPEHYHILLKTERMKDLRREIGLYNGRSSFQWNREDGTTGRKVWRNCFERKMKSERHYYASLNYVLHNAVHHGYAKDWKEWPWSNAVESLERTGRETALSRWKEYPLLDYGKGWDD